MAGVVMEMPDSSAALTDLELWDMRVDSALTGEFLDALFTESPHLPGVIVMEGEQISTIVSRRAFYSVVDKAFSRQIYWRRAISVLVESLDDREYTVVPAATTIAQTVQTALARPREHIFDPLIVDEGGSLHLLEADVLLRAAASVLAAAVREKEWLLDEVARLNIELYAKENGVTI
ncbi:MAG TPA: hypothetical protein VGN14_09130 [Candidatus Elarobacter sp.]|jgi:hypothetical protein